MRTGAANVTTVVASVAHGCIAADTRITGEGSIANIKKLHRMPDGSIVGLAGDVITAFTFLKWWVGPKTAKDYDKLHKTFSEDSRSAFTLLELSDSGLALIDGWGTRVPLLDREYALGTGGAIALSHVRKGMTPEDAIRETPGLDECSGFCMEPDVEYLIPPELQPKRTRRGK
jgi:hypothetical protein